MWCDLVGFDAIRCELVPEAAKSQNPKSNPKKFQTEKSQKRKREIGGGGGWLQAVNP